MPNIKGIDLSDGIQIIGYDDVSHYFTEAQIVAYLASHSWEQTEVQIANWANANIFDGQNDQMAVKIMDDSPLDVRVMVAVKNYSVFENGQWVTKQYQIPDGWWE